MGNVMLRIDARQGAPKEGQSPLELFEVDIYPLRIHLSEILYTMMWEYLFPEDEQDAKRQVTILTCSRSFGGCPPW